MNYLVGLDQGGSKTAALVADEEGRLLGFGIAGGSCYPVSGEKAAMDASVQAINQALAAADISMEQVAMLVAGMTGADWPDEYEAIRSALSRITGIADCQVYNDCMIALRAGTTYPGGAVICSGSAMNAAVRAPDGREQIYGDYIIGPDCGGGSLGKQAIQGAVHAYLGILPESKLTAAVPKALGLPDIPSLVRAMGTGQIGRDRIRRLAPLLMESADAGDSVSIGLLQAAGAGSAEYVAAGIRRLNLTDTDLDLVLSGGIFKSSCRILCESIVRTIHKTAPRIRLVQAEYEPVVGAVLFGLESWGQDHHISSNIRRTAEALGVIRKTGDKP